MDDQSLRNTLAILRVIKGTNVNETAVSFIKRLVGSEAGPRVILQVASHLLEQFAMAELVIVNSQLVDEAKSGVLQATKALSKAFQIENMNGSLGNLVSAAPGYISNLVILLSAAGLPTSQEIPEGARDLADEIRQFQSSFDDEGLDPLVRDVAKRHMEILATLLRHVPIFGVEAALVSYFEFVARLRRSDVGSSPEAKEKLQPLFAKVQTWGERIKSIDEVVNRGASLFERASQAKSLLQYLPGVVG